MFARVRLFVQADCEKLALELTETKDTCTVLESAITQASSDSAEAATLLRSELLQEKADELTAQRLALSTCASIACVLAHVFLQQTVLRLILDCSSLQTSQ